MELAVIALSASDWIAEGHLDLFFDRCGAPTDTAGLYDVHPNDGPGWPAYGAGMIFTLSTSVTFLPAAPIMGLS